jgi:hypothetical protein
MHIFDYTLKPILLYNSEVWGSYQNTRAFDLDNICKHHNIFQAGVVYSEGLHEKLIK